MEHIQLIQAACTDSFSVYPSHQIGIALRIDDNGYVIAAYVLRDQYFRQPGLANPGCAHDQRMANTFTQIE